MTVDQADNKTITKGGGTYIIKDDYSAITLLVQMMGLLLLIHLNTKHYMAQMKS